MIFDYTEMDVNFYDLTACSKIEIQYTKTARSFDFLGFRSRGLNLTILEHLSNLEFQLPHYIYIYILSPTHTIYIYIQVYNTFIPNNIVIKTEKSMIFGAAQQGHFAQSIDIDGGKRTLYKYIIHSFRTIYLPKLKNR